MAWMVRLGIIEGHALCEVREGRGRRAEMKQDQPEGMVAIQQADGVRQALCQRETLFRQESVAEQMPC